MKGVFWIVLPILVLLGIDGSGQIDTAHINASGQVNSQSLSFNDGFYSFSLTDSVLYVNFDKEVKTYQKEDKSVMITVAKGESEQRSEFVFLFYKNLAMNYELHRAYTLALKEIKKKYKTLDFKSKLLPRKSK